MSSVVRTVADRQQISYLYGWSMRRTAPGLRTTIYLAAPAAKVLERVRTEWDRYGIATKVSSVLARLLLGESIDEVVDRPYRGDLASIASERDKLRDDLRRATKRQRRDLHRIRREIADLYPRVMQIVATLGRAKRRDGSRSADLAEAVRIETSLNELMAECADAIVPTRPR